MSKIPANKTYEWATGLRPAPASEIKTHTQAPADEHHACDVEFLLALEAELDLACENPF